jgi:hypothetical protein
MEGIMTDINSDMKAAADYAIRSAKERFGQDLDYSEQSINKLEDLLDQAFQDLSSRPKDENTRKVISRTANIWGSYMGELMRQKWGGMWKLSGSERMVLINNIEFFPIKFVYQKLTTHPEYSAKNFIIEAEGKIYPFLDYPELSQNIRQPKRAVMIDKTLIYTLAGIGGFLLVIIVCMLGYVIIKTGGLSAFGVNNLSSSTNTPTKVALVTDSPYPLPTQTHTTTPYPSYTPNPTYTSAPSYTPYPTFTQLASQIPTGTEIPSVPTNTQPPFSSPTPIPESPTDTPKPPTVPPIPTYTERELITILSCEVEPFTVPSVENVLITYFVRFSSQTPGYSFQTLIENPYIGQRGCLGVDSDGDGVAYCDGSSGLLPGSVTVYVTLRTSVGDCVASYRTVNNPSNLFNIPSDN